jgi:hypothetical protein
LGVTEPSRRAAHVRRPSARWPDAFQAEARVVHAQRLEQAALHRLAVELPGGREHDVADQAEGDVLVGIAGPPGAQVIGVWYSFGRNQVAVVGVGLDRAVEGMARQADAMAQHVGDRDPLRGAGLLQPELGRNSESRLSQRSAPSATSIPVTVPAKPLDSDASRNTVCASTGSAAARR